MPGSYEIIALTNYASASNFCGDTVSFTIQNLNCDLSITNVQIDTAEAYDFCVQGSVEFDLSGLLCGISEVRLIGNINSFSYANSDVAGPMHVVFDELQPGDYTLYFTTATCTTSYPVHIADRDCYLAFVNPTIALIDGAGVCTNAYFSTLFDGARCHVTEVAITNIGTGVVQQTASLYPDPVQVYDFDDIPAGNYNISAIAANGCTANYNLNIQSQPCSNIQFSNVTITPSLTSSCLSNFGFDLNLGNCPGSVLELYYEGVLYSTINIYENLSTEVANLAVGNYNYHLTTGSGCIIDYPFEITPNACNITLSNSVITNTGALICSRGRIDFDVNGTTCGTGAVALIQNGTILNTINWTSGNGLGLNFSNLLPGDYSIVAVNNLFDVTCGDTITFNIPTNPCTLSISNIATNSTGVLGCTSGTVNFSVSGTFCQTAVVAITNTSNATVFSTTMNSSGNQSYSTSGLPSGTYTILFGNVGCYIEETFTIAPNPCNLSINNVVVTNVSGSDNCTMANVSFTPMGDMCSIGYVSLYHGTIEIASLSWSQNTAPNFSFQNLAPGVYTLFAGTFPPNYCIVSYEFEVLPSPCTLNIFNAVSTLSNGSNGIINVTGAGTYCGVVSYTLDEEISAGNYNNITTNSGSINTQFNGLAPGNYRVTISSADSPCQDVEYITVYGAACNTNPIISATSTTVCPGLPVTLNSNYLTGNVWSNGGNSFNTQVTTAGTYTLTVTELNGCTGTASITITNAIACVPATQMSTGVCGTLNYVKTSSVTCLPVSGATQYEWQFSNSSGVFATKTTTTNYVLLHSVTPALNWGTNWNIKVRAKIGVNVGPYSPDCAIGIMPDPSINGVPQTQLRTQDCNKQNYRMNADNRIIANPIAGAIQYEFEFSSAITGLVVATKLMTNNVLFLNTVTPALTFPAQYNVRVRARIGSTWGVFGTPCLIGIIGLNREEENSIESSETTISEINADTYFEMMVMPNPFNEQAILNIHSNNDEQVNVEVFDMVGNIVWKQLILSNTNLNFGIELAQGTYIVKAMSDGGKQAMFRFIKSK